MAEYAQDWLAQLQVKPSTASMYGSIVRHQLGSLADMRLTRVGPPDIRAVLEERKREGYAGRTRRAVLDVLRMVYRMAEGDGLVDSNPAALVTPPKIDAKEPVHLDAEQAKAFLAACKGDSLHSLYAVALGTGLRRGELLALTWKDVDTKARTVTVRRGKTAAAARIVPLPAFAADVLPEKAPGPIWPYSPGYVTRHVGDICKRAKVPEIGMHGLRHSCASILLAEGVDPMVIRQILGHTKVSMTAHYARAEQDQKRAALERLGKAIA